MADEMCFMCDQDYDTDRPLRVMVQDEDIGMHLKSMHSIMYRIKSGG